MAVPNETQHGARSPRHAASANDDGQAQTKTLGVLVAVMVVAGVVALVLTLFSDNSNDSSAATQPSGSQVGKQTTSAPSISAASSVPSSSSVASSTGVAPSTSVPARTTPASSATTPKPAKTSASTGTSSKVVKYTVKKGDNLTLIAKWFRQRGVAPVYDWNKSIIGTNPNLIFPGQTIIVSLTGNKMTKVSTGSN